MGYLVLSQRRVCVKQLFVQKFKEAYANNDLSKCRNALLCLILAYNSEIKDGLVYDHNLKHLLFNANCILNPMGVKYTSEDYGKYAQILTETIRLCEAINDPSKDTSIAFQVDLIIDNKIIKDIVDIMFYTYCFYNMNSINSRCMDDSAISKMPFVEQLLSIILFYEDQIRILKQNYRKDFVKNIVTGLEMSVADRGVEYYEDVKTSILDSLESHLESINEILRYLYYQFGKSMAETVQNINFDVIHPYENVEFEKHLYIASQRQLLCRLEENIRYGYYCFHSTTTMEDGNKAFVFSIENDEKYKAKCLGVYRREYQVRRYSISDPRNQHLLDSYEAKILSMADGLVALQSSEKLLLNIENYHPDVEDFKIAQNISKIKEHLITLLTKEYYLKQTVKGVTIEDLLKTYYYLNTLSEIACSASAKLINDSDQTTYFKELCIVDTSYFVGELSRIYGFDIDYSKKLIDRFIFHEANNRDDDVFAQPLLKISKTQVLFSPALIDQVNPDRYIERQFIRYKKDVSATGRDFENYFISTLKNGYLDSSFDLKHKAIPNFTLNENKIEYMAFDGKAIEFDVVAVLGDYLILTELKAVMTSYELSELETRKLNVYEAIDQLHRRKESIKYDWEKFKEKASIPLPELPFDDDHIILIACTDTFDFTPLKDNDVYITDDSTYLKYFTNPYVETMELSFKEGITVKDRNNIWLKGYPEAEEFLKYLMNPVTIHPFADYMEKQLMPIPAMDENDLALFCEQFVLSEDPIKAEVSK